jgi:hypothetical protein
MKIRGGCEICDAQPQHPLHLSARTNGCPYRDMRLCLDGKPDRVALIRSKRVRHVAGVDMHDNTGINRDDGSLEGGAFILAALHLPRRGTPTRLLGQRYGLEARPQRRGPAR